MCKAFNCRILYGRYAATSHSFPSPTHSFIPGLKPPFSVNPSHRSLSFLPQDAMHAQYQPRACFRLSVCLCVTSRCTTKTAKHRITQRKQHDSSRILVFFTKDLCKIRPGSPPTGTPNAGGWVKIGDFRQIAGYISKTVGYKIDAWFLLQSKYILHCLSYLHSGCC